MRIETYECDRCHKKYTLPEDVMPNQVGWISHGESFGDKDFCEECEASFAYFMEYVEDFDRLADKLALKETGESDE